MQRLGSRSTFVDPELSNVLSLDANRPESIAVALARRLSIRMQRGGSQSTFVDPELSRALSLDACRSKCKSAALARRLSSECDSEWKLLWCHLDLYMR